MSRTGFQSPCRGCCNHDCKLSQTKNKLLSKHHKQHQTASSNANNGPKENTMATYSSCRMDLSAGVDRTQPLPLRELVHEKTWNDFCDQVEVAHRSEYLSIRNAWLVAGIAAITGFIMFAVGGYLSDSMNAFSPAIPMIGFVLFISGPVSFTCFLCSTPYKYEDEIKRICTEFSSTKFKNVTVHYRKGTTVVPGQNHNGQSQEVYYKTAWLEFMYPSAATVSATANPTPFYPSYQSDVPTIRAEAISWDEH